MSERWVKESEQLLRKLNELTSKEKKDRLETISSIIFAINVLERSVRGWKRWVGNLSLMSQFTGEELAQIEEDLEKQIQVFVKYDIEVTKRWNNKFPRIPRSRNRRGLNQSGMFA